MPRPGVKKRFLASLLDATSATRLSSRQAFFIGVAFIVADLLWSTFLALVEPLLGVPLHAPHQFQGAASTIDTLWHLATAFVLVLPTRNRLLWVLGPLLALGLDVDHLFGGVLATPFPRLAHDLIFAAALGAALFVLLGRAAGLLGPAALLAHVAVDGGGFPLVAPFSPVEFTLGYPAQVALVIVAGLLFYVALRSPVELRRPRPLLGWVAAVAALCLVLFFVGPGFVPFTSG